MQYSLIKHNSSDYWECVALRDTILRKPLDLTFSKNELLLENNQIHFAIKENYKIIACLSLVLNNEKHIKMRQVCVDTILQNKGIGKTLVLHAEKWAIQKNYKLIYCHARASVLPFYEKLGYKKVGNTFLEVGIPHFKMEKLLV